MMEAYGSATREEVLNGATTSTQAWEQQLRERVDTVARYDKKIELRADYRPKWKTTPQQVWQTIADISDITPQNIEHILYAKRLVMQCEREDFQHRF